MAQSTRVLGMPDATHSTGKPKLETKEKAEFGTPIKTKKCVVGLPRTNRTFVNLRLFTRTYYT